MECPHPCGLTPDSPPRGRPGITKGKTNHKKKKKTFEQRQTRQLVGCALTRRVLRNTPGFMLAACCFAPAPADGPPSAVPVRPFLDEGIVRLRTIGTAAADCDCDCDCWAPRCSPPLLAPPPCRGRSSAERWWRWMIRQPSGPSPSLTLVRALASYGVIGGVWEREGVGGTAGGGGVSSMNQSWCAMRNSSTSWLSWCSVGESSWSGCDISPGRKITARSTRWVGWSFV